MDDLRNHRETIEAEAAEWVVKLGAADCSASDRARLEAWRRQSPEHEAIFQRACQVWAALGELPDSRANTRPLEDQQRPQLSYRRKARGWYAVAASLLVAVLLGGFYVGNPLLLFMADYRTAPGEIRTVTLADGSRVQLNTRSAITIDFDGQKRRIKLLAGEAAFTVTPAAMRPFVVEVAAGEIRALGTRFVVHRQDETVEVIALEHRVEVSSSSSPASRVLEPGQAICYDSAGTLAPVETVDRARVAAWRQGRLIFDRQPLAAAVAELNRYRRNRIVIVNETLGKRKVSGVFRLDNLDNVADMITPELDAHIIPIPPFVTLLY